MENKDRPISPIVNSFGRALYNKHLEEDTSYGLTKREYMSTAILSGLCANYLRDNISGWDTKTYVTEALELTDELLKQLENK